MQREKAAEEDISWAIKEESRECVSKHMGGFLRSLWRISSLDFRFAAFKLCLGFYDTSTE